MQKVLSSLRKSIQKYNLIENGDKIAVGISGGKDSLVLLVALNEFKRFGLYNYELQAILIDIYSGNEDYEDLKNFCLKLGIPLHIEKTDIKNIVFEIRHEKNPCSLCAKMRRGALNSVANKLGCNKLALGHHLQDVVNTFFISLFYEGRLSTMQPKSYMSNSKITLIRPLYLVDESKIINASKKFPILKSKCPADKFSKRQEIKDIISQLMHIIPDLKKRIEHAIIDADSYNLLNKKY